MSTHNKFKKSVWLKNISMKVGAIAKLQTVYICKV